MSQYFFSSSSLCESFDGKKPTKVKLLVENPETISAHTKAHGPGIGKTSISFSIQAFTIFSPGSEIAGVPASETTATSLPSNSVLISFSSRIELLCS